MPLICALLGILLRLTSVSLGFLHPVVPELPLKISVLTEFPLFFTSIGTDFYISEYFFCLEVPRDAGRA